MINDLTCKRGSVGHSEGLLISQDGGPIPSKIENSNLQEFEPHRPSIKGTKLLLKVIKAIIIITMSHNFCSHMITRSHNLGVTAPYQNKTYSLCLTGPTLGDEKHIIRQCPASRAVLHDPMFFRRFQV